MPSGLGGILLGVCLKGQGEIIGMEAHYQEPSRRVAMPLIQGFFVALTVLF